MKRNNMIKIDAVALRQKRKEKKVSQQTVADTLHCTRQHISDFERGHQKSITPEEMKRLEKFFNTAPGYFSPTSFSLSNAEVQNNCDIIQKFINRIFKNASELRESDLIFLRQIMEFLKLDSQLIEVSIEKIKEKHDNSPIKDLSEGARRPIFEKKLIYDAPNEVARKIRAITDTKQIHAIDTFVSSLKYLEKGHIESIEAICESCQPDPECKPRNDSTYTIQELLFQWFSTSVINKFEKRAYVSIYNYTFNEIGEERETLLRNIKSQINSILDDFIAILDKHIVAMQKIN